MTPAAANTYGADESGLICGYRLGPGRHGQDIGSAEAAQWLAARHAGAAAHGEFLWLHFNLAHTGSQPWLEQAAQLLAGQAGVVDYENVHLGQLSMSNYQ